MEADLRCWLSSGVGDLRRRARMNHRRGASSATTLRYIDYHQNDGLVPVKSSATALGRQQAGVCFHHAPFAFETCISRAMRGRPCLSLCVACWGTRRPTEAKPPRFAASRASQRRASPPLPSSLTLECNTELALGDQLSISLPSLKPPLFYSWQSKVQHRDS